MKFSKTSWFTIVIAVTLCVVGLFVYQCWQIRSELVRQAGEKENLEKQLMEAKKEIKEDVFQECGRLKIVKPGGGGNFS